MKNATKKALERACSALKMVVPARIELATHGFSEVSCKKVIIL
jgi:hypothetical protein